MNKPTDKTKNIKELRGRVERQLATKKAPRTGKVADEKKLAHELQAQQIVLEMQNEALREACTHAELALKHYSELFDFAPIAYITLTSSGIIKETNFSAGLLLGAECSMLAEQNLDRWVAEDSRLTLKTYLSKVFAVHDAAQTCEIALQIDHKPVWVSIRATADKTGQFCLAALLDISERVRAEKVLTEQLMVRDQIVKAAEIVPGLICSFRLKPDGSTPSMTYASQSIESLYGFSHNNLVADFSPVFMRIHSDDIGRIHDTIAESARTQQPWHTQYRYHHPTKSEVWHEVYSSPLCEMDGSILWHGYIQDVTERIQTENELQERTARYKLVLNGAQDGIWDWDVPNKRIHFSSRWKGMLGFAENEIDNTVEEWSDNIHPDDQARVLAAVQSHFEGKRPVFCEEYRMRCKDGSWKWILDRGIAQKNSSGEVIRMAGSGSDITERKLAEMKLREHENELRLIMDATPALMSYIDTDLRYLRINAAYENWFGITAEHILGHKVPEILGEKAWRTIQPYIENAQAGEQVKFDLLIHHKYGEFRWAQASYIPHKDAAGKVKGIIAHIIDITDRKLAEQKITSLNQKLRHRIEEMQVIFDTVPIGLGIADDGKFLHTRLNPAGKKMLGSIPSSYQLFKPAEPHAAFCTKQNRHELSIEERPMQRVVRGELVTNQIIDVQHPDGQIITLLSNASPLFNEEGKPRGAIGVFLDITALKKAEESLRKSQLQLRLFIEQAPLSIAMFDRKMNYLVTSRRWIEEYGRGYDNLTGRNHYIINPDISAEWKQVHARAQAGEFLGNDEDLWIQADGSRHWLRWAAYPWINLEDEIGGIIISCEDITARRQAEQELRDTEIRLALVVEQVKAGYWDWDIITQKLFLSPGLKRQIGFDDNELLNQREEWESRLHPDDRDSVLMILENFTAGHLPSHESEFRLRHKDGSYRWIHSRSVSLKDQNNRPYRLLGINLDITDYIRQKEFSERRGKIEQSSRLYVALQTAAAFAHELNQPLTAISSYADVALHMCQTDTPNLQKLCQVMENCSEQAQRAGNVIRQLIALLQKGEAVSEPIDINTSVIDTIDLMKADGLLGKIKIELDLASSLPLVMANATHIQKILINLLSNSLESVQAQEKSAGKITVITHRYEDDSSMIKVTVRDSGKGVVDTAELKKIFEPFHSTKPAGLGMGLPISRSLVAAHGGKMWAEQNAGNGISIHFTLPCVT